MQITLKGSDLQCMHGSVFAMPAALPTERYPTYESRVSSFVSVARDMASEVSDAEKTDADWLNDPEVQAEMNAWIDSRSTPEALDEWDAWVSEQERIPQAAVGAV